VYPGIPVGYKMHTCMDVIWTKEMNDNWPEHKMLMPTTNATSTQQVTGTLKLGAENKQW